MLYIHMKFFLENAKKKPLPLKVVIVCSAVFVQKCKKVQSSIEKFHWSKKLRKTEFFFFNLNLRVPLESVNLFLHVFLMS